MSDLAPGADELTALRLEAESSLPEWFIVTPVRLDDINVPLLPAIKVRGAVTKSTLVNKQDGLGTFANKMTVTISAAAMPFDYNGQRLRIDAAHPTEPSIFLFTLDTQSRYIYKTNAVVHIVEGFVFG